MLADRADHVEVGPAAVAAQRALERRQLAERADEHRPAPHAEQPHQLERDAVVARAQQRHEHRREHERDPEDAVEAVERHAGDRDGVERRDERDERQRADHRVGAGSRLALAVEAGAREHEHQHERDELQPGRDRRPRQPEQHLLAAVRVAQHERRVERERDAGEIEQHQHERRQQPAPPVEEDERVEAEAAGADVVRGGCHVASDGTPPQSTARLSHGAAAPEGGSRLGPMGRWREAATDALAIFAASRLLVLAVLLWPPTQVHAYLTTWDAGFYLDIARCGYDPACGPPVSAELPAFFPLQPFAARVAGTAGISEAWGGAALAALASLGGADPAAPPLQRAARPPHGASRLRRGRVLPVRVRAQHELLGGPLPAGLDRGVQRGALAASGARVRWPASPRASRGRRRSRSRSASRPMRTSRRSGGAPRSRAPRARSPAWPSCSPTSKRRRDDWLASLHAQQLGWNRSTSIVDAPGELARYVWDAITLGTRRTCST